MAATYSKVAMLLDSASETVEHARARYRCNTMLRHRLLNSLTADELERFIDAGEWLSADTGDTIAEQGSPVDAVTFITDGTAREEVASTGSRTYRAVVGFLGPGDDVGLFSLIDGAPHHSSAIAMRRVQALRVSLDEVRRLLSVHTEWYKPLAESAVSRLRAHGLWLQALV